jgi:adenine-specific DNA-methyltransferase
MSRKQRLELTWIGKEARPRLEPRILVEDPNLSYHSSVKLSDADRFENILIHGDNLLALRALESEFFGKVKCIYIDPPFNTDQAFEHYDDSVEHSLWLSLMRERMLFLHNLLAEDGTIFVHIDDVELGYLIVLMDEVFGRSNRMSVVTFRQGAATGHKTINKGVVSTSNFVVMYARQKEKWQPNRVFVGKVGRDKRYNNFVMNIDDPFSKWQFETLQSAFYKTLGVSRTEAKKTFADDEIDEKIDEFVSVNAGSVIQFAQPNYDGVSKEARSLIDESRADQNRVFCLERVGFPPIFLKAGKRILFYSEKMRLIDGKLVAADPLTSIWDDLPSNNLHQEGGVDFPKGKKPESLIKRCIELSTVAGDLVLDSFAGSGTTGAVAHKTGRRWIMVELGEHCQTHIIPRMRRVIDGTDTTGITEAVGWKGGGGFRYYRLAPSLIERDQWGQPVISPAYNAAMLAEAMCKLMGFRYEPSADVFWQQGRSSERDFIYTTTRTLAHEELAAISAQVGDDRSLLICCKAFRMAKPDAFPNLTVKKIPNAVLAKCEWGKDDYSLNVANLPMAAPVEEPAAPARTKRRSSAPDLFDQATAEEEPGA